jgi:hypothetical protein
MRKSLLITFLLLVCATWVVAQGQGDPTRHPGNAAQPQGAPGPSTIEGCLGGSAGNFTVTDKGGVTYGLQLPQSADASKLSQHIGEEVRVMGTMSGTGANTTESAATQAQTDAGTAGKQPAISVSKMDKIGDTCNNSPAAPSK